MKTKKPRTPHPGTIRVFDARTGQLLREIDATKLPDAVRCAKTEKGWVAVTRIVEHVEGARLSWRCFGEDGRLLEQGVSIR